MGGSPILQEECKQLIVIGAIKQSSEEYFIWLYDNYSRYKVSHSPFQIGRTENGILQLHEDLIEERESAKVTRKQLRGDILATKRQKEQQLNANDVAVRQIERLKSNLLDVKHNNQEKRMVCEILALWYDGLWYD